MIKGEKNSYKAKQIVVENLNDGPGFNQSRGYYQALLGLAYSTHQTNLIPNRFKWGISMIKVVD